MGLEETISANIKKAQNLREQGIEPYPIRTPETRAIAEVKTRFEENPLDDVVGVAGRLTGRRAHGKVAFGDIQDETGKIQLFMRSQEIGPEGMDLFNGLDLGDWVWARGPVVRTRRGEISVDVRELVLLSKSLRPFPDKWKGIADPEIRYRQRYVDLMVNPSVKQVFRKRATVIDSLRELLQQRGFLEVETPALQPLYGGAAARPFVTHHHVLDSTLYLRIALELHLKRLLVGGLRRVFEIGKCFRNEGMDRLHNPEFTLLEAYEAFSDSEGMMSLTEDLIRAAALAACGRLDIEYQGTPIDLGAQFECLSMIPTLSERLSLDPMTAPLDDLAHACHVRGVEEIPEKADRTWFIDRLFSVAVEPELVQPTFVTGHPLDMSPLAKSGEDDPERASRFELFVAGRELVNGYSELNDPVKQRERLLRQRRNETFEEHLVDEDFLRALEYGMPPAGGLGLGVDRLVMLLTDQQSIQDVILFPQMRPEAEKAKGDVPLVGIDASALVPIHVDQMRRA